MRFWKILFPGIITVCVFLGFLPRSQCLEYPEHRILNYQRGEYDTYENVRKEDTRATDTSLGINQQSPYKTFRWNSPPNTTKSAWKLQVTPSDEYELKKKTSIRRVSKRLFPIIAAMWRQTMGESPERKSLQKGIDNVLRTFWEPLLTLNKMAYISWLPIVAAALSLITKNSIVAGVVFLMLIATSFQKKALLAKAAGAATRRSIAPRQPKRRNRLDPYSENNPLLWYFIQLPESVYESELGSYRSKRDFRGRN